MKKSDSKLREETLKVAHAYKCHPDIVQMLDMLTLLIEVQADIIEQYQSEEHFRTWMGRLGSDGTHDA